jgi:hypothetical protein
MRKFYALITLLIVSLTMTSCGPTTDEAIDYNDAIIDQQTAIIDKIDQLYDSFKDFDSTKMDIAYDEGAKQITTGTDAVSKMEAFDGKTDFRDSALVLFKTYKSVFDNEFKQMIAIYKLSDADYTKDQEDMWNQLSDGAIKKMDDGLLRLKKIQGEFAKKYKFDIQKSI